MKLFKLFIYAAVTLTMFASTQVFAQGLNNDEMLELYLPGFAKGFLKFGDNGALEYKKNSSVDLKFAGDTLSDPSSGKYVQVNRLGSGLRVTTSQINPKTKPATDGSLVREQTQTISAISTDMDGGLKSFTQCDSEVWIVDSAVEAMVKSAVGLGKGTGKTVLSCTRVNSQTCAEHFSSDNNAGYKGLLDTASTPEEKSNVARKYASQISEKIKKEVAQDGAGKDDEAIAALQIQKLFDVASKQSSSGFDKAGTSRSNAKPQGFLSFDPKAKSDSILSAEAYLSRSMEACKQVRSLDRKFEASKTTLDCPAPAMKMPNGECLIACVPGTVYDEKKAVCIPETDETKAKGLKTKTVVNSKKTTASKKSSSKSKASSTKTNSVESDGSGGKYEGYICPTGESVNSSSDCSVYKKTNTKTTTKSKSSRGSK